MKNLLITFLLLISVGSAEAKHTHSERYYQQRWADANGGVIEYRLEDGKRVDILTDKYAIEVDFARKFYEAVGQSLLYSARTDKLPGIILIVESKEDERYREDLDEIIECWQLPIKVWVMR